MFKRRDLLIGSVLAFLLSLLTVEAAGDMLVERIDGSASQIQVLKADKRLRIARLSLLTGGEVIHVTSADTFITLIGDDGRPVVVGKDNSPFVVKHTQGRSWIDNAVRDALEWYHGLDNRDAAIPTTMITRSAASHPLNIRGVNEADNRIPNTLKSVTIFWSGGTPPFYITLSDADGKVLLSGGTEKNNMSYAIVSLPRGIIRFTVQSSAAGRREVAQLQFQITGINSLPPDALRVFNAPIPAAVRHSLLAMLLAEYSEWRFAALQYALLANESRIVNALSTGSR